MSAAVFVALASLLFPLHALAQLDDACGLEWRAPAGCPGAQQIRQRVRELLGGQSSSSTRLRASATVARTGDRKLQLTLATYLGDSRGERRVEGASCQDLANAAAIHLALLLRAAQGPERVPAPEPSTTQVAPVTLAPAQTAPASDAAARTLEPAAVSDATPRPDRDDAAARAVRVIAQLPAALAELGALAHPALGLGLAGGLDFGSWRVSLEGQLWLKQTLEPVEAGPRAELQRVSAGVRGCRTLLPGRLTLAPCLRVGFEHMWARGAGPHVAARSAGASWLAFGAGLQARLGLTGWLGVVAQVDGQLAAARPRFTLSGSDDLGQRGQLALRFCLGAEWIL